MILKCHLQKRRNYWFDWISYMIYNIVKHPLNEETCNIWKPNIKDNSFCKNEEWIINKKGYIFLFWNIFVKSIIDF